MDKRIISQVVIVFYLLIVFLVSCKSEFQAPLIITGQVTDIDSTGAVFHAKITSKGIDPVLEFGFVWDTVNNLNVDKSERYVIHQQAKPGHYTAKIAAALIPGKTYFVKAYIRSAEVLSYGETTGFVSMGGNLPEVSGIFPLAGSLGDTLVIVGRHFSSRSSEVKINKVTAQVLRINQDSVFVKVPLNLTRKTSEVTLKNLNHEITAKDSFTLISPVVSSFEATTGTYGDEVIIRGSLFSKHRPSLKVAFDKVNASFSYIDDNTLKAIVPNSLDVNEANISVTMNHQTTISSGKFSLLPLEINDFSPKVAVTGNQITITGRNFSPVAAKNKVFIGGVPVKTLSVSSNSLVVNLPLQDTVIYNSRNALISVEAGGTTRTFDTRLQINDPWFRRANAPYDLRYEISFCSTCTPLIYYYYSHSFVIDKTAYIGLNAQKGFWAYDTETDVWRRLADFPGVPRIYGAGFVVGSKIYFGTGSNISYSTKYNDWWEYDTQTDKWTRKADFPYGGRSDLLGYSISAGQYVAQGFYWNQNTGYGLALWKYNPTADSWSAESVDVKSMNKSLPWQLAKPINDEVFVGVISSIWDSQNSYYIYNQNLKTFKSIAPFPNTNTDNRVKSMVLNNKLYVCAGKGHIYEKIFYVYDRVDNIWKTIDTKLYTDITYGIAFEAGKLGFAGLGSHNHLYEFDPER
jgi:hypothetical protein